MEGKGDITDCLILKRDKAKSKGRLRIFISNVPIVPNGMERQSILRNRSVTVGINPE